MGNIIQFKAKKNTGNYTHFFDKKEVIKLSDVKGMHQCTMGAGNKHWNCPPEQRAEKNHDGSSQFCFVSGHGMHTFAGHGEYNIINYSDIAVDLFEGKKNWITVRDHDNHEWNFECPKELVHMVIYMLADKPYWLKFVLKYGLAEELAFHLAYRYTIQAETNRKIYNIENDYGCELNGIRYRREPDGSFDGYRYFYNDKIHNFEPNELYTDAQKQCLFDIAFHNASAALKAVYAEHREKIQQQDKEGK